MAHFQMQETIPVTQLVRETAAVMQEFTQSGYVTIRGTSFILSMKYEIVKISHALVIPKILQKK